jgi:hypothetical protein
MIGKIMKALVYRKTVEDRPKPELHGPGDAIVKIAKTTSLDTREQASSNPSAPAWLPFTPATES